jgi:hypothetical protein
LEPGSYVAWVIGDPTAAMPSDRPFPMIPAKFCAVDGLQTVQLDMLFFAEG